MRHASGFAAVLSVIGVLAGAACSTASVAAMPSTAALAASITTQLPRTVRPSHYDVAITPDAQHASFAGSVGITLDVLQPTTGITLNAADLRFASAVLVTSDGATSLPAVIATDDKQETATFSFERPVAP
ncbi:MAG: M1 family peptidase, partial [Herminiimonas sp.]|nr:M1 family peptidase [Herminiimonas sp.]